MLDSPTTLRTRPHSRRSLRTAGLWLAVTVAIVGLGAAPSSASSDDHEQDPTGTWNVAVTVHAPQGPSVADDTFVFHADHQLSMDGPAGPDGKPLFVGSGFWHSEPDGSITFYISHPNFGGGPYPGAIQAIHQGRIKGNTLSTSAYAFVTSNQDGSLQGPVEVTSAGTWVSSAG